MCVCVCVCMCACIRVCMYILFWSFGVVDMSLGSRADYSGLILICTFDFEILDKFLRGHYLSLTQAYGFLQCHTYTLVYLKIYN